MTHAQAVKILVKATQRELKHLTINANLYDRLGLDDPNLKKASVERRRIVEAIAMLENFARAETTKN